VNEREGWTAAEDTLPPALLAERPDEPSLPEARLREMVAAYYRERGWGADGRVPAALRAELGLDGTAWR
jgi:aldehyde:ferredoxin oxidoreductase